MREPYLKNLAKECANYRTRIYLISAQNLTATGTLIDAKSQMAGMTALSTANPYVIVKVGNGINN